MVKYLLAPISRIQAPRQSLWSPSLLFKLRFIALNFFLLKIYVGGIFVPQSAHGTLRMTLGVDFLLLPQVLGSELESSG